MHLLDPGLVYQNTDALFDPLYQELRFQSALRELQFPD